MNKLLNHEQKRFIGISLSKLSDCEITSPFRYYQAGCYLSIGSLEGKNFFFKAVM